MDFIIMSCYNVGEREGESSIRVTTMAGLIRWKWEVKWLVNCTLNSSAIPSIPILAYHCGIQGLIHFHLTHQTTIVLGIRVFCVPELEYLAGRVYSQYTLHGLIYRS